MPFGDKKSLFYKNVVDGGCKTKKSRCMEYMHGLHTWNTYMEYIHGIHTWNTYTEYIHRIHAQNTYMEHIHKSLQYFECLPPKNRSSGDVTFFSGILSMRSIILDTLQGLKTFRINTF